MARRVCAVHQPNLFPRWRTLAKLLAADTWVVLDDVQFCRRDYQHRTRLGHVNEPSDWQWLILPVHLPDGRGTVIRDVQMVDRPNSQRRVSNLARQYYRRSRGWQTLIADTVDRVSGEIGKTESLSRVAELSTRSLLRTYGWQGTTIRSSELARTTSIRTGRSARLADLTRAVGCHEYLCGRSGRRYLEMLPFVENEISVSFFDLPASEKDSISNLTTLAKLAEVGPG